MFSLTGGGKYNFLGTKRWIEENLDHAGKYFFFIFLIAFGCCGTDLCDCPTCLLSPESSLLQDNVAFVLCLDTLANSDELYMHVSRPPKPGTPTHTFIQLLEEVT